MNESTEVKSVYAEPQFTSTLNPLYVRPKMKLKTILKKDSDITHETSLRQGMDILHPCHHREISFKIDKLVLQQSS